MIFCNANTLDSSDYEVFRYGIKNEKELFTYIRMWEIMYSRKWSCQNEIRISELDKNTIKEKLGVGFRITHNSNFNFLNNKNIINIYSYKRCVYTRSRSFTWRQKTRKFFINY